MLQYGILPKAAMIRRGTKLSFYGSVFCFAEQKDYELLSLKNTYIDMPIVTFLFVSLHFTERK